MPSWNFEPNLTNYWRLENEERARLARMAFESSLQDVPYVERFAQTEPLPVSDLNMSLFTPVQCQRLDFYKWLYSQGRLTETLVAVTN